MARPDTNSSIKPFFDNAAEGVNQLPSFLTAKQNEKNNVLTNLMEDAVEEVTAAPAKSGVTTGLLNLVDIPEEERTALRERDDLNKNILSQKYYADRIDEINKLIPQRRQPELEKLYNEIRRDTDFNPLTLGDRFKQFRGFFFNDTADIHRKVANGEVRVSDLRGDDLTNYLFGIIDTVDISTLGLITPITVPIRMAINAARAGKNKLAQKFLVDAGDDVTKTISTGVERKYGTQDPVTQEKIKKTNKAKQTAKIDKYDSALGLYYGGANNSIAPTTMAGDVGTKVEVIEEYARNNPNSFIAKFKAPVQVERGEQVTEEVLEILRNAVQTKGGKLNKLEAVNILKENNTPIARTTLTRILNDNPESELAQLVGAREVSGERAIGQFYSYFPGFTRESTVEARAQHTIIRDMYRAGGFGNEEEFLKLMDEYGFVPNRIKRLDADGKAVLNEKGEPIYDINPEYDKTAMREKRNKLFAFIKDEYFKEPGSYEEYLSKVAHAKNLTDYAIKKFVDTVKNNEGFRNQFVSQYKSKYPNRTASINDDVEGMAFDYATTHFNAQMSHIMPIGATKATTPVKGEQFKLAKNLEGQMFQAPFLNVNFAAHNIGTQKQYENIIRKIVSEIKNGKNVEKNLNKLVDVNKSMTERGLETYLRFSDKQMPDNVFKILKAKVGNKAQVEPEQAGVKSLYIGEKSFSLEDNIAFFDMRMDGYVNNPSSFKISNARPKSGDASSDEMFIKGDAPYIGEGKPTNFVEGGDVETEQEKQSIVSKAASAIGNLLVPKAEALPLPKNFLLGNTPQVTKKVETKLELPAPEAPVLEKRYDIYDDTGKKVFQSKSLDDAQQKALRLGDLEGKTFTVKEVDVPVKVKKKPTTKPGTALVPTVTPETIIGSGNNKLFYSELDDVINQSTLNIRGKNLSSEVVSMSAKDWHDWFRSKGIKESELYDSYIRSYLNKKGGFNRETGQFTNDQKISYAEIKELVDTSPTNYLQTVSYGDATGTLKYGDSGRHSNYIDGTRTERVLWIDSKDIRGDVGSLPEEIRQYEGHGNMRRVDTSPDFGAQNNTLVGEPYVVGWSLSSHRNATLNNRSIKVNIADEIQSDFLQKAASLKSDIKAQIRRYINDMTDTPGQRIGLDELYKRLENVFRPMPATFAELKKSIDELIEADAIFQRIGKMEMDDITKASFKELGEAATKRDLALQRINSTIDNIDSTDLFPNIPLKDQKDWVDAIIKNDIYHAAKARFSFDESGNLVVNQSAPSHYAVVPSKAVKAYQGGRGVEVPPDADRRSGKMVAYDMQYGGPNLNDHTGQHFTSNVEETLNKIANMKNSKVEVGKVDMGHAGSGVDTFMIELTPDMLTPYKAYKKDGGLVKKSILYTPIVSLNDLLSPIGANAW
tara:strand:- start:1339 stop:5502 length:4164 start_codon:yes stop_codon:yes gene_type:complete